MRFHFVIAFAILLAGWCFVLGQSELSVAPGVRHPVDWMERLPIDGTRYVLGARGMIERGDWIYAADTEHSVGMQVLGAALYRIAGGVYSKRPVLWWNFCLWFFLSLLFAGCLWRLTRRPIAAAVLTLPILLSTDLFHYANLVQHEVTTGVLCFLLAYLAWRCENAAGRISSGFLIAVLSLFRVHFALLLPLHAFLVYRRGACQIKPLLQLGIGFAVLAVPWNGYYSARQGHLFFSQSSFKAATFSKNQSYASTGRLFPKHEVQALNGWKWVKQDPLAYARLLGRRLSYLNGEKTDQFSIESRWVAIFNLPLENRVGLRRALWVLALCFSLWGLVVNPRLLPFAFPAVAVVLPIIFINYSFRFFVPALPSVMLLLACGLHSFAAKTLSYPKKVGARTLVRAPT